MEMLIDLEEKKDDIKTLEMRERELTENIDTLEKEDKQKIAGTKAKEKARVLEKIDVEN